MKTLKTLSIKTFAVTVIVALAAGCASVTDANFETPEQPTNVEQPNSPAPETFGNDDDVQPIYDRPTIENLRKDKKKDKKKN